MSHNTPDIKKNEEAVSPDDLNRYVQMLKEMRDVNPQDVPAYGRDAIAKTAEGIAKDLGLLKK